ncbi:hypothetical protein [Saccharothrix sp.]|uniref:hypothetical protein n=1 Tax=Saccharothrix sp. TaxID=1873460 RepID=UPI0035C806F1
MAGNGTSMALAGAYLLAGELATAPDHVIEFRRYEERMREYVDKCQKFAFGGMDGLPPKSRMFIRMRDLTLRIVPHVPGGTKIFGDLQKIANTVTFPDYRPVRNSP